MPISPVEAANIAAAVLRANSSPLSAGEKIPVSYFYSFNGLYNLSYLNGSSILYRQSGTISFNLSPYDVTYAIQSDMNYINLYVVPDGNPFVMSISNATNKSGFSITSGGTFTASCSFYSGVSPYTLGSYACIDASSFDADWRTSEDNFYLYSSANAVLGALRSPTCVTNDPNYTPQGNSFNGNTYVLSGIPAGAEMDYAELRLALINDLSVQFDIDVNALSEDVPIYEEMYPTEPTEPTEAPDGFVFDYDEVISPTELQGILAQETYDISLIDDKGILTAESMELPEATFSAEGLNLVVDTVTVGKSFLDGLGLWVPFLAAAVVVVLIRFLR